MTTRTRTLLLKDPCLAQEALALLAPEDPTAISDGRVFVDRRRIEHASAQLNAGQSVAWNAARRVALKDGYQKGLVLEQREGIVAASKPAAWSSEPDRTGSATSLREQLVKTLHLNELHIFTRLDVGVSGLVLAATNAESRRHLATVGAAGVHRSYLAVAAGHLPDQGSWHGAVAAPSDAKPRNAITYFECAARLTLAAKVSLERKTPLEAVSLAILRPKTGHRHQLRIHSSRAGAPLVGDRRYGGPHRFIDAEGRVSTIDRILLHAIATNLPLPSGKLWQPQCPVPEDFRNLWLQLGGSEQDIAGIRA